MSLRIRGDHCPVRHLLKRRHENRSTIMTSNSATAILDRFLEYAQVVSIEGRSYRLKRATSSSQKKARVALRPLGRPKLLPLGRDRNFKLQGNPLKPISTSGKTNYCRWSVLKLPEVDGFEVIDDTVRECTFVEVILGDANGDHEVDISDAISILGNQEIECLQYIDVNRDSELDISDAIYVLRALFLGEGNLPGECETVELEFTCEAEC